MENVTKSRQDEYEEFVTDNSAVTLKMLGLAMKKLNNFYEIVLHKATSKVELIEEVQVYVNLDWRNHNRRTHGHRRYKKLSLSHLRRRLEKRSEGFCSMDGNLEAVDCRC